VKDRPKVDQICKLIEWIAMDCGRQRVTGIAQYQGGMRKPQDQNLSIKWEALGIKTFPSHKIPLS